MRVARDTCRRKPVLVLRSGVSEYGRRAAASHTGAMAGSAKVFEAVVRQSGLIATTDPDEFLDLAFSLSYMPLPRGRRVAVITMGGGWGVLSADEVWRQGLQLATLPQGVLDELSALLPPFWSHGNPVDLVGATAPGVAEQAIEAVVRSDAVDAAVVLGVVGMMTAPVRAIEEAHRLAQATGQAVDVAGVDDPGQFARREDAYIALVGDLMNRYDKPILNVSFTPLDRAVFPSSGKSSTVVLPSPLRAVRVVAGMARYQTFLDALDEEVGGARGSMSTRTEHDSLGPVEVPADALYGAQTQRAVENFPVSGQRPHPDFVWAAVLVKKAAALANIRTGQLDPVAGPGDRARGRRGAGRGPLVGPVRGRSLPGRRGHVAQHERQRGPGQPGQRTAGWRAGHVRARAPERSRQHGAVVQRRRADHGPAGGPARVGAAAVGPGAAGRGAGREGGGVRRRGQVGAHPSAGCGPAAPGRRVRRLPDHRAQGSRTRWTSAADGAARAQPRGDRGGHGHQRRRRLPGGGRRRAVRADRVAVAAPPATTSR